MNTRDTWCNFTLYQYMTCACELSHLVKALKRRGWMWERAWCCVDEAVLCYRPMLQITEQAGGCIVCVLSDGINAAALISIFGENELCF